jgi:dipeptidase D
MSVAFRVASFWGGSARNAIPREAWADVVVAPADLGAFEAALKQTAAAVGRAYAIADEGIVISSAAIPMPSRVWSTTFARTLLGLVQGCVNGVVRMSDVTPAVVESSSNLALLRSGEQEVVVECLVRSLVDSEREDCVRSVVGVMELAGAVVERGGAYPGWQPKADSRVVRHVAQTYAALFGKEPHIQVVHAGLECGVLGAAYPALDMVSMGPTIRFPHSPDERVEIASVGRFWALLCETLKGLV